VANNIALALLMVSGIRHLKNARGFMKQNLCILIVGMCLCHCQNANETQNKQTQLSISRSTSAQTSVMGPTVFDERFDHQRVVPLPNAKHIAAEMHDKKPVILEKNQTQSREQEQKNIKLQLLQAQTNNENKR
jgi:hypothetical protein